MSTPLLSLHQASVHHPGGVVALESVDLQLQRGQRLALLGANGSGKTTLLRTLVGLQTLSSGQRLAHGSPQMAMVFQRPFLLRLSVQANVSLALFLAGVPRAQRAERTAEALQRVGLLAQARRSAHALSGGQQQRVALARALALRPDVLLLDEPTAALDPTAKREVETLIADIATAGVTLVMSTHNLGQAKRLASDVAYLESGRLVVQRPVDAFFNGELPAAAAQFLKGELPWT